MKKDLIRYGGIILLVLIGCAFLARSLNRSETLADVAAREKTTEMSVKPEIEPVIENSGISQDVVTESAPTPIPTPIPTPTPEPVSEEPGADQLTELDNEASDGSFYIEPISDELKEKMRGKSYADDIDESKVVCDENGKPIEIHKTELSRIRAGYRCKSALQSICRIW